MICSNLTKPKPWPTEGQPTARTRGLGFWFFLLAIQCTTAVGQVYQIKATYAVCDRGRCVLQAWRGSSVAVGRMTEGRELLLTAAHTVTKAGRLQKVEVAVGNQWRRGVVRGYDRRLDLAVVEISGPALRSACLAGIKVGDGTDVMAGGFPEGSQTVATPTGKVIPWNNPDLLRFGIPTRSGMSGGGLFSQDGQILGIITAAGRNLFLPINDGTGFATSAPACRSFLIRTLGGIPDCRRPRPKPMPEPDSPSPSPPKPNPPMQPRGETDQELLRKALEELRAYRELEKARLEAGTVNTGLTERIVVVEGPPGRDGRDGQDADVSALSSALEDLRRELQILQTAGNGTNKEQAERLATIARDLKILQTAITATQTNVGSQYEEIGQDIAAHEDWLENLQKRLADDSTASRVFAQNTSAKLDDLKRENQKLKEAVLALEKWRQEHKVAVQILDPTGRVIKTERFGFHEPIQLQLKPRTTADQTTAAKPERIGF